MYCFFLVYSCIDTMEKLRVIHSKSGMRDTLTIFAPEVLKGSSQPVAVIDDSFG